MALSPMMEEYEDLFLINTTNITDQIVAYEEKYMLDLAILLTITYTAIFIVGILGNVSTCIVIFRNRSMHTATNFYLLSLAVSDLILLVCGLPFELHKLWNPLTYPLGEVLCIAIGLASEMAANATVLTITAFTVERYIAICRPFRSHTMLKLSRAVRFIFAIWIISLCTALPQAMQFGIVTFVENGQNMSACTVKGIGVHQLFVASSFVFFVGPMSVITVLYVLIGIKLRMSLVLQPVKKLSVDSNERARQSQNRKSASQRRVIRMLIAVALSFFLCWAPFHVQRLLAIYGKNLENPSDMFYTAYVTLTFLSGVFYYLSTAINPFLYNIMSNKFRKAFKMTLASWCGRGGPHVGRTYNTITRAGTAHTDWARLRRQRRLSTVATQQFHDNAPVITQCYTERDESVTFEAQSGQVHCGLGWQLHLNESSYSAESPRSISNSSLREVEEETTGEELATYMYHVNCDIAGRT